MQGFSSMEPSWQASLIPRALKDHPSDVLHLKKISHNHWVERFCRGIDHTGLPAVQIGPGKTKPFTF
jgi:hypothetical protein